MDMNCSYCAEGKLVDAFGIKIGELPASKVYLFKEQSHKELAQFEKETLAPLRIRLIELLGKIGRERGYAFIYDTDTNALPFMNPDMGDDLNLVVKNALK